jgi:hypothetical protein
MHALLDFILTVAHLAIIGFNVFGWIWRKTRKAHLILVALTAASWFLLGIWYGWGYCFLTDWHWNVKRKLGETDLPNSFIKYAVDRISGSDLNTNTVDGWTLGIFMLVIAVTVYVNFIRGKGRPGKN